MPGLRPEALILGVVALAALGMTPLAAHAGGAAPSRPPLGVRRGPWHLAT